MKKLYITLFLLIPVFCSAQSNYKPGYVVNLKGDTLHGLINYREWDYTPKNIEFKTVEGDRARQLGTNDISCFNVDGLDSYQGYTVKISMDKLSLSNLSTGIDTASKTEAIFLKVIQTGKNVTLYAYTDLLKTRFYIKAATEAKPSELVYRQYLYPENANTVITADTYRRQLTSMALVFGIDDLNGQIQQLRYNSESLIGIVSKLNGVNSRSAIKAAGTATGKIRFFAGAALNISSLKYDVNSPFPNASAAISASPKISIGFETCLTRP